ncbi:hypothetical protein ACSBR2_009129 [Camellia fascicularis]
MVGVKITKRASIRQRARPSATSINAQRIIMKTDEYHTEARKREEILFEFIQNPHSRERARIACLSRKNLIR